MSAVDIAPPRSIEQVTTLTIELLANQLRQDPVDLRLELDGKGSGMPVDSLDMFDILQEFRARTGLTLPVRALKRETLRSVAAFAHFVVNEAT